MRNTPKLNGIVNVTEVKRIRFVDGSQSEHRATP
jgi:hypothetical protein